MAEGNPRLADPNPKGIYTAVGLRNAVEGDGFLPGSEPQTPSKLIEIPKKKAKK